MHPLYFASKSRACEEAMRGRSDYSVRSGAMRRSPLRANGKGNTLMYSTPRIIASLDATLVLAQALGEYNTCSRVWCPG